VKITAHVRPTIGDIPVGGVPPCLARLTMKPARKDGIMDIKIAYVSGPTRWVNETDEEWTGVGVFSTFGDLLYRYRTLPKPFRKGDSVTLTFP